MLTRKQYELLVYIDKVLKQAGVPPSYDEMKDALDLKSKSGIHRLITGLEERGFIKRLPHKARALEVLRLPENLREEVKGGAEAGLTSMNSNVIKADFGVAAAGAPAAPASTELPLLGRIAAGTPIEALRDNSNHIDVPPALLGRGEHYALEVEGDSMIDAGIHDGDTVVIQRTETAESGDIVVALVDQNEATLKRLRKRGASIALEPANKEYETQIFGPDRVRVQGRLVALLRKY